ncbi:hypothetical protein B0H10DRAFT_1940364 [Mycena sp. CBHHK59/15]|nr:hypothetical protein B0H10DRAFT_1940364 [Mycena sp. CBHHK59/15]
MFRKLTKETKYLQNDIELLDLQDSSNPLLDSMQHHLSGLCAIWDLWDILPVTPGNLGVMIPGDDPRRPYFQKIGNIAEEINAWLSNQGRMLPVSTTYLEYGKEQYIPSAGAGSCWSSEIIDTSTIRHSLQLGSAPQEISKFGYSHARRISLLGNSSNYHASWSYLRHLHETGKLRALAGEHNIHPSDLMLSTFPFITSYSSFAQFSAVFWTSERKGYLYLMLQNESRRDKFLKEVGARDGVLHYFESLAAAEGELYGIGLPPKSLEMHFGGPHLAHLAQSRDGNVLMRGSRSKLDGNVLFLTLTTPLINGAAGKDQHNTFVTSRCS